MLLVHNELKVKLLPRPFTTRPPFDLHLLQRVWDFKRAAMSTVVRLRLQLQQEAVTHWCPAALQRSGRRRRADISRRLRLGDNGPGSDLGATTGSGAGTDVDVRGSAPAATEHTHHRVRKGRQARTGAGAGAGAGAGVGVGAGAGVGSGGRTRSTRGQDRAGAGTQANGRATHRTAGKHGSGSSGGGSGSGSGGGTSVAKGRKRSGGHRHHREADPWEQAVHKVTQRQLDEKVAAQARLSALMQQDYDIAATIRATEQHFLRARLLEQETDAVAASHKADMVAAAGYVLSKWFCFVLFCMFCFVILLRCWVCGGWAELGGVGIWG